MSARLASFRGPSTPSSSPIKPAHSPRSPPPPQNNRPAPESPYHRKLRAALRDLRAACDTWDDLVRKDGLRAVADLVDARTDLDNMLALVPPGAQPRTRLVGPKLAYMDARIAALDAVLAKLRKQLAKMGTVVDALDALLADAHRAKGWRWVCTEPLWTTWPLEKFVTSAGGILRPYRRALEHHAELVGALRSHAVSFEAARAAVNAWNEQPWLEDGGWDAQWEDLCAVEVAGWDAR
ncbi:hypothetical protein BC834DRAFT_966278 [Gloeopeniophorella convolvens]|nr:hypothetical protein BC834DRAFT_966278 [Gloeopeniophorella convolvens]